MKSEVEVEVSKLSKVFRTVSAGLTSPVFHTDEKEKRGKKESKL